MNRKQKCFAGTIAALLLSICLVLQNFAVISGAETGSGQTDVSVAAMNDGTDTAAFPGWGPQGPQESTKTDATLPDEAYSLEWILNRFNLVSFSDLDLNCHCMGSILVKNNLTGTAESFADSANISTSSYIGGYYSLAGSHANRGHSSGIDLYVGSSNMVYNNNESLNWNWDANKSGKVYTTDSYVKWDKLKTAVQSASDTLAAQGGRSYNIDYDWQHIQINAGTNVTVNANGKMFTVEIVGTSAYSTVINVNNVSGNECFPRIVNNWGTAEDGTGMSVVWNLVNAPEVVKISSMSTPIYGHIIAPNSTVNLTSGGNYNGCIVAGNIKIASGGEGHLWPYNSKSITERPTGGFAVTKTVDGNAGDVTKEFSFTATLSDTTINGTYGNLTFVNGTASFTLKNGETKQATGLSTGVTYTVTEADYTSEGYETVSNGTVGTITEDTVAAVSFTNTKEEETTVEETTVEETTEEETTEEETTEEETTEEETTTVEETTEEETTEEETTEEETTEEETTVEETTEEETTEEETTVEETTEEETTEEETTVEETTEEETTEEETTVEETTEEETTEEETTVEETTEEETTEEETTVEETTEEETTEEETTVEETTEEETTEEETTVEETTEEETTEEETTVEETTEEETTEEETTVEETTEEETTEEETTVEETTEEETTVEETTEEETTEEETTVEETTVEETTEEWETGGWDDGGDNDNEFGSNGDEENTTEEESTEEETTIVEETTAEETSEIETTEATTEATTAATTEAGTLGDGDDHSEFASESETETTSPAPILGIEDYSGIIGWICVAGGGLMLLAVAAMMIRRKHDTK